MDAFRITGGAKLSGQIAVNGSKNAALPILATSILADGECTFRNVPALRDIRTQVKILNTLGVETRGRGHSLTTRVIDTDNSVAPYELQANARRRVRTWTAVSTPW